MAYNDDQREFPLPGGSEDRRRSSRHLPRYFRTQSNNKFLSSTFDQLIQPGVVDKLNGYLGRKTAPGYQADDFYLGDVSKQREDYQLEPAAIVKDDIDNILFYGDYNDYINQIRNLDGDVDNHSILNRQEYYSWDPHIDWDKFVNFREYYWLPNGPQSVPIAGDSINIQSTYTVTSVDNLDNSAFVFSPDGLTQNPELTLYRGVTYRFDIDSPNLPISFRTNKIIAPEWTPRTSYTLGESVLYEGMIYISNGSHRSSSNFEDDENLWDLDTGFNLVQEVSKQSVEKGVVELTLFPDTPDFIYYVSDNDINAGGLIRVYDAEEASFIDVEKEIIGKKSYTTGAGFDLTNGMKVYFQGTTAQEEYQEGAWYVEGVGTKIKLISEDELNIASDFVENEFIDFDTEGFDTSPYSKAIGFPRDKDYLTINRSSGDGNLWSKYNRWFHRSVIDLAAEINKSERILDQNARATRPIIEFQPNLKLFDFGTETKRSVDLVDDFTTDVFSTIEGAEGYNIDGVDLTSGMRVLFTQDTDIRVSGKIYDVEFITFKGTRQIALREADDADPKENQNVLCKQGSDYKGKILFYDGETWNLAQQKTSVNQPPLFDVFDCDGNSLADTDVYQSSTFAGTKVFSYKLGNGILDPELGFPLSYRSIQNAGDIVFDFNLINDAVTFCPDDSEPIKEKTGIGFLKVFENRENFEYINGWKKAETLSEQPVVRQYQAEQLQTDFIIDVYDNSADLDDLSVKVFLNNSFQTIDEDYVLSSNVRNQTLVRFVRPLQENDIIQIKTKSSAVKNENGKYEIAINLERNPLNDDLTELTLGEINDHVRTIVEDLDDFEGDFPGRSNLRDRGDVSGFGRRIVKHSAPFNLALYHLLDEEANLVKSLKFARQEYGKFKRNFLQIAFDLGFNGSIFEHFERIMKQVVADKSDTNPFYFSDMVALGGNRSTEFEITSSDQRFFSLSKEFNLNSPSDKSVLVYLNGVQLLHGADYTFNSEGFVVLTADIQRGDNLVIYEFESTNASFVPPTPTKLGLYPKFEPKKFIDDTYLEPRAVIQGHDGSIITAFDDFRDDLILELEKRIYNNIKVEYDKDLFNIHDYLPGAFRNTGLRREQIDNTMISDFIQWTSLISDDYTENNFYNRENPFTFNYTGSINYKGDTQQGFWRNLYQNAFDTDRPHTHPWEMLGFSQQPDWWEAEYGAAPYTSNNLLMWEDIEKGIIREPGKSPRQEQNYTRPGLISRLPVDSQGKLLSPIESNYVENYNTRNTSNNFVYGDRSPVETAWRKSSEYPFALLTALFINQPNCVLSVCFDRTRQKRGLVGDIIYEFPNTQIRLSDLVFPNSIKDNERTFTAGLVNYIRDYISSDVTSIYDNYRTRIRSIDNQISAKLAGYTDKEKFRLILDSRTPLNEGNVFVPEENYKIFLNTSTPVRTVYYSGVIIEKTGRGFLIRGYNEQQPYFEYTPPRKQNKDPQVTIGGISATPVEWVENRTLTKGTLVQYRNSFYRVTISHVTSGTFEADKFAKLPKLPIEGGREALIRQDFQTQVEQLPYGTVLDSVQDVVDFLLGYGNWLETQGLVFDYYDEENGLVADWITSTKEFLFWTTQNWADGSVISVSPAAFKLKVRSENAVVDDIYNTFYGYSLLKVDGNRFDSDFVSLTREEPGEFEIEPRNTEDGIFGIRISFVQKEHVLTIDNRTQFGDIIYDQPAGYRQERIRALGYRTAGWDGSLSIPGFIYDEAKVEDWQPWKDYSIGDLVRYKEFFYAARNKVAGSEVFEADNWNQLSQKPESGLVPNFEYKTNQFADFYDLDTDNFDAEQQKFAQHLIGYQNRDYLANIINDDVSQYKFYQGFIQDKGTQNAFTKLFDALGSANRDSLELYEEWAIKTGQYGAADGFEEVEYILDEDQFKLSPQPIELVDRKSTKTDLVYRIQPFETYLKPRDYDHAPFPEKNVVNTFVKNSGYVHPDDIDLVLNEYDELSRVEFSRVNFGSKIWIGNQNNTWNVYTHLATDFIVNDVDTNESGYDLYFDTAEIDFEIGDIIGVFNLPSITGFYKIFDIENNIVKVEETDTQEIQEEEILGRITRFVSSRFENATAISNNVKDIDNGLDRLWIDESETFWKVLDRNAAFIEQDIISNTSDSDSLSYGSSLDSNAANTVLAVGAPDEDNGKVYVYSRASNREKFKLVETLEFTDDVADNLARFGADVAVSSTGEYIAVGSPAASNVRSFFEGEYVEEKNYPENSIVQFQDSLWQAVTDIEGAVSSIEFGSFDSVPQKLIDLNLTSVDSEYIPILLAGNYPFVGEETDHFIVRAPAEQFEGSTVGDTIKLKWNTKSYAYQSENNLSEIQPFNGDIADIDADLITGSHVIAEKINSILFVDEPNTIPQVGQIVETSTGFGTVAYRYSDGSDLTIYIKDQNGDFGLQGSLITGIGEFVGEYETEVPTAQSLGVNDEWQGFWKIDLDFTYITPTSNSDPGRGLIYNDVIPQGESDPERIYYNILDFESDDISSFDTRYSELSVLTYVGPGGETDKSNKFLLRAPKELTDSLTQGSEIEVFYNSMRNFETGEFLDPELIGLKLSDLNRKHVVDDLWDGYIDFEITANLLGVPIEPKVGIVVKDLETEATALVTYYQRLSTTFGRVYVKNVQGTWSSGRSFFDTQEIGFIGDGSSDPVYGVDRKIGQIQSKSLGYAPDGIGQMIVLETEDGREIEFQDKNRIVIEIPTPRTDDNNAIEDTDIVGIPEYWFYLEGVVQGAPRLPNIPAETNNDWIQVYRLPAGAGGVSSGLDKEGLFTIYQRTGRSQWTKISDFTIPQRQENNQLGTQLEFAEINGLTKLFVSAAGSGDNNNYGSIFVIKNGEENNYTYSWELGRDKNYKGEFSLQQNYFEDDIVFLHGTLYKAQTNIVPGEFDIEDWEIVSGNTDLPIDYLGFIPNNIGLILDSDNDSVIDTEGLQEFSRDFDVSNNGEVLITSAFYDNTRPNRLIVYRNVNGLYLKSQEIEAPSNTDDYGNSISISNDGRFIAVGAPLDDADGLNQGTIYVYKQINGIFELTQNLYSSNQDRNEQFGFRVAFDGQILAASSRNGDSVSEITFDDNQTIFDGNFTRFRDYDNDVGIVQIYEFFDDRLLYAQSIDLDESGVKFFGRNIHVKNSHVYVGMPRLEYVETNPGTIVNFRKPANEKLWNIRREIKPTVDVQKIKKVFLYDTATNELIQYLDYIDPLQGKIAGIAEQEIDFKLYYDPAVYTEGTGVQIDETNSWGSTQVGKIWWDLTNAKFIYPYQSDVTFSANNWSTLFSDFNSIDVYEWVEADILPSTWDRQSGTEQGFSRGITGTTRYGDNAYVIKRSYDRSSQTFTTKYYYWVRNKSTVPNLSTRQNSAQDIADLIRDPQGEGYRYVSFISPTEFAVYNCNSLVKDRDVAINVQYWTIEDQSINVHDQYQILSEGLASSKPNRDIEQKWFDSLVGYDVARREVPSPELSPKEKYGALNTPRQSWFVNKTEALKQTIERVNSVLVKNLIVDEKDISRLTESEPAPSSLSGEYDRTVEAQIDLEFVGVARLRQAELSVEVENGKITQVNIDDSGRGYQRPPKVSVLGTGNSAEITVEIDNQGSIISASIDDAGEFYQQNTPVRVRKFAVLVENDETIDGQWSIYERDNAAEEWIRISSQGYNVGQYWNYINWYAEGYGEFTNIDHRIDASYELQSISDEIGDIVKIENIGSGGWLLLEKIDDQRGVDYTINYKTIGRENGTIQFSDSLYDVGENLSGFDVSIFDGQNFDGLPTRETRIILETIRDSIFSDDLEVEYNKLFFASLRYVLSEQNYIDWAFKTSFMKAQHNVGELRQKVSFQNDNLPSYERYVNEVKPYSTTIREYLSSYEKLENARSMTTDFDLPPRFNSLTNTIQAAETEVSDNRIVVQGRDMTIYPDRHWLENSGFSVQEINLYDRGEGYTSPPVITIEGGGGTGATAVASVGRNGTISAIKVVSEGEGYLSTPRVLINGSISENGRAARAIAKIGGSPVRNMHSVIKFDRVSGEFDFVNLKTVETFNGTGSKLEFDLEWPMDLRSTRVRVFVNGAEALGGVYTYQNVLDTSKGYDRRQGKIVFENAPADGRLIEVEYFKDINLLNAQDRINAAYDPTTGQLGKSLGQLMEGIDYGGVHVTSFGFSGASGWDSDAWTAQAWDVFDTDFEDEIIQLDGSTIQVELSQPLESGVTYNIYRVARDANGNIVSNQRMDDPNFGTSEQTNKDAVTESIQGDGSTTILYLDELNIPTTPEDSTEDTITIVVRKTTSDGSIVFDPDSFDTALSGGDLAYETATGLKPEDIIIDGDGFVTPTTSKGPEEIIPGQVLDTLDIKVYESPVGGASAIVSRNYVGDGSKTSFDIGTTPIKKENVFVKIDNIIQNSRSYSIAYESKQVEFDIAPQLGERVSIIALGNSASEILDIESFTGDGATGEFLTSVRWSENIEALVTVNGEEAAFVLEKSTNEYEIEDNVVVKFATPPKTNAVVNVLLVEGSNADTNYSVVTTEEFIADGSTTQFMLENRIFAQQPALAYTLVKVNDRFLSAGFSETFTITNSMEYQLDLTQIPVGTINASDVEVYLNGEQLDYPEFWTFIGSSSIDPDEDIQQGSIVKLEPGVAEVGDELKVYVITDGEYRFGYFDSSNEFISERGEDSTMPVLHLDSAFAEGDKITVYNFSNHDSQGIERTQLEVVENSTITTGSTDYFKYVRLERGLIELNKPAHDAQWVWVILNGELLTPSIDYYVTLDRKFIQIINSLEQGDVIDVIHFSNPVVAQKFGWRQFKDMLNRTHYKRLGKNYSLASGLNFDDKEIQVENADGLPQPDLQRNLPGVIFLDKERIEYFFKDGNTLKQLRRGTLGTGIKEFYPAGTEFMEQGSSHNLPYQDSFEQREFIGDDTTFIFETDLEIENANAVEIFVAGKRLRKSSIDVYNKDIAQDSPEGDEELSPEFEIEDGRIVLDKTPTDGAKITVIKKKGTRWSEQGVALAQSATDIGRFLQSSTTDLPR